MSPEELVERLPALQAFGLLAHVHMSREEIAASIDLITRLLAERTKELEKAWKAGWGDGRESGSMSRSHITLTTSGLRT